MPLLDTSHRPNSENGTATLSTPCEVDIIVEYEWNSWYHDGDWDISPHGEEGWEVTGVSIEGIDLDDKQVTAFVEKYRDVLDDVIGEAVGNIVQDIR